MSEGRNRNEHVLSLRSLLLASPPASAPASSKRHREDGGGGGGGGASSSGGGGGASSSCGGTLAVVVEDKKDGPMTLKIVLEMLGIKDDDSQVEADLLATSLDRFDGAKAALKQHHTTTKAAAAALSAAQATWVEAARGEEQWEKEFSRWEAAVKFLSDDTSAAALAEDPAVAAARARVAAQRGGGGGGGGGAATMPAAAPPPAAAEPTLEAFLAAYDVPTVLCDWLVVEKIVDSGLTRVLAPRALTQEEKSKVPGLNSKLFAKLMKYGVLTEATGGPFLAAATGGAASPP